MSHTFALGIWAINGALGVIWEHPKWTLLSIAVMLFLGVTNGALDES